MPLLLVVWITILAGTLFLVLFFTRRTLSDKFIEKRMEVIHPQDGLISPSLASTEPLLLEVQNAGRLGWLESFLQKHALGRSLQATILEADSTSTVSMLVATSAGIVVLAFAIAWIFVPLPLVDFPLALLLGCIPYWVLVFKRSRRINALNAVLADTIDMLARALRAGYSMAGAIGMVADNAQEPAATEFGEIFKQQNLGLPLRDCLLQLLTRYPSLDLRVLVTAILVQKETGGNLAEILDRTVFVIRERLRIQGEIRTQTAQGRLTGWILSALPLVMYILINVVNPGYSSVLLSDPVGRKLIYISVGMVAVGAFIIHRIVNGIEV